MPSGTGLLNICVDIKRWKKMPVTEKDEHIFYALQYLVSESQKNKITDRMITLAGSIVASIVTIGPIMWMILRTD